MSEEPDLWEQVLAGAPVIQASAEVSTEEAMAVFAGAPDVHEMMDPELFKPIQEVSVELDAACSWCDSTGLLDGVKCCFCAEARGWVPEPLTDDTDVSWMSDDQLLACMAMMGLPSWLVVSQDFAATAENVKTLGSAFVGKRTPVPVRRPGGTWSASARQLESNDFARHFAGKWSLGAYLLDDQDCTGVAVFDIDYEGDARQAMLEGDWMAMLDLAVWARSVAWHAALGFGAPVHATLSGGKGAHVVYVLPERTQAAIVRRQMRWMCVSMGMIREGQNWRRDDQPDFHIECYPKQDEAGDGLGNLIRLPSGTDPGTGRKSLVITDRDSPMQQIPAEPLYCVEPRTRTEQARRQIQRLVDDRSMGMEWVEVMAGGRYQQGFSERCAEVLVAMDSIQSANAVGQAIHAMCFDPTPMIASGLLADLETLAEMSANQPGALAATGLG